MKCNANYQLCKRNYTVLSGLPLPFTATSARRASQLRGGQEKSLKCPRPPEFDSPVAFSARTLKARPVHGVRLSAVGLIATLIAAPPQARSPETPCAYDRDKFGCLRNEARIRVLGGER